MNVRIMRSNWLLLIRIWVSSKASSHIQLFPIGSQLNGDYTCTKGAMLEGKARPQQRSMVKNLYMWLQLKRRTSSKKGEKKKKKEKKKSIQGRTARRKYCPPHVPILLYSDWLWEHPLPTFPPSNRTEWTPQATVPSRDTKRLILKTWRKK